MIDILDFIPYGKTDSPISRESLCYLTGLSDRSVRDEIARAKKISDHKCRGGVLHTGRSGRSEP